MRRWAHAALLAVAVGAHSSCVAHHVRLNDLRACLLEKQDERACFVESRWCFEEEDRAVCGELIERLRERTLDDGSRPAPRTIASQFGECTSDVECVRVATFRDSRKRVSCGVAIRGDKLDDYYRALEAVWGVDNRDPGGFVDCANLPPRCRDARCTLSIEP